MLREMVFLPAFVGSLLMVSATPAPAQNFCAARSDMVKSLNDKFAENQTASGLVNGKAVVELFVSESGSWTILATGTDGKSCVVSAGEGWEINLAALGQGV